MQLSLKENPNSHYNRYLAFFLNPAIRPGAMRQEVAAQFLNPDLMLLDADRLLEDETIGRVQKEFERTRDKLLRNASHGALTRQRVSPTTTCQLTASKRTPVYLPIVSGRMSMTEPHNNPNKLFGKLGSNHTPLVYEGTAADGSVASEFMQKLLHERQAKKYGQLLELYDYSSNLKEFTETLKECDQFEIMRRVEDWEKRVADMFVATARQTGKTWSSMFFREAVTTGCNLAGTWLKPLYAAMYKRGPTIQ